jgi:hypothetical protein
MNERQFRRNVLLVMGTYALALAVGIFLRLAFPGEKSIVYPIFKDLIPLLIAIPAAWLTYCFQRRQAYLKDVRELWSKMIAAIQEAIQYTHSQAPEQTEYGRVLKSLSTVTEELRAVFMNVSEEIGQIGLYPFESIKTVHGKVSALRFGSEFDPSKAATTRKEIVDLWKRLRRHFLNELDRGLPAEVDSPYLQ